MSKRKTFDDSNSNVFNKVTKSTKVEKNTNVDKVSKVTRTGKVKSKQAMQTKMVRLSLLHHAKAKSKSAWNGENLQEYLEKLIDADNPDK